MERILREDEENDWDGEVNYVPVEGPWIKMSEKEVWEALKRMKKSKSSGSSKVTCEMFSNDVCVRELCGVANGLLMGESMPESWKRNTVVPLYKCKGNVLECGNYRAIELLEHGIKVVERVFEKRLRKMVEIREEQYGFVAGKGTIDAIFILR